MGFFDLKSRQLRRKLRDLRSELKQAETDGRFVRADGVYFAELDQMGDMTIRAFGTGGLHAAEDEHVLRTFFDRNGFTIEELKFEKGEEYFAELEIVPPNELLRHIASLMKDEGFRVIDDGERETLPNIPQKILPVSSLARTTALLFAERVNRVIATTDIKNNKEGNRLLKWMPQVVQSLRNRLDPMTIQTLRPKFDDAYAYYYTGGPDKRKAKRGAGAEPAPDDQPSPRPAPERPRVEARSPASDEKPIANVQFPKNGGAKGGGSGIDAGEIINDVVKEAQLAFDEALGNMSERLWSRLHERLSKLEAPAGEGASSGGAIDRPQMEKLAASEQMAKVLGAMYHSLIRAKPHKCVSNSETILKFANRLFNATATCIMTRVGGGDEFTIFAQAGKRLVWGEGGARGFAISTSIIRNCVNHQKIVTSTPSSSDPTSSMIMHKIETAAAAPITIGGEITAILYVDRREGASAFTSEDMEKLRKVTKVFAEFADLTLGVPVT